MFQRPLTPILLQIIVTQIFKWEAYRRDKLVVAYMLLSAKRKAYFCKSIAIEMGGASRYSSKASGSGVDFILLSLILPEAGQDVQSLRPSLSKLGLLPLGKDAKTLDIPEVGNLQLWRMKTAAITGNKKTARSFLRP